MSLVLRLIMYLLNIQQRDLKAIVKVRKIMEKKPRMKAIIHESFDVSVGYCDGVELCANW